MLQLTFRRFLRELDEAPGGNNLQYILKCPCIPFFGNQGLHNEIMLGGNGGHSGVMCKRFPYNGGHLVILTSSVLSVSQPLSQNKANCSLLVFDKENSIESLLDLLHYIYNYYHGYASCFPQSLCLLAGFFVTCYDHDL